MAEEIKKDEVIEEEKIEQVVEEPKVDYQTELAKLKLENEKLRKAQTNASADASEWKKKFRATQSEQERAVAEQQEILAQLQAQNDEYKARERTLSYKTKLMESGYDAETANTMANALPDGIGDDFFAEQKRVFEQFKTKAKEEVLSMQPTITGGKAPSADSLEDAQLDLFRKAALGI